MLIPDTFTPEQFEASLTAALKDVAPTDVKPLTVLQRLTKFRAVLKKYRAKGYSAQQIATALAQPPIGLQVSASLVRKAMNGGATHTARRAPRVTYRAVLTPAAAQPAALRPAPPETAQPAVTATQPTPLAPQPRASVPKPSLPLSQPANAAPDPILPIAPGAKLPPAPPEFKGPPGTIWADPATGIVYQRY